MDTVKFYSEYDWVSSIELKKIVEKIKKNCIEKEWEIIDLVDFHNILKYISVPRFCEYLNQETGVDIESYEKEIKQKTGVFIGKIKAEYLSHYDEVDFQYADDFFEIFKQYKIYLCIEPNSFEEFITKDNVYINSILKFKEIVEYFDEAVKVKLLSNHLNSELIISIFLDRNDLYLPKRLMEIEILDLLDSYIQSEQANLNVLRKIITFPPNKRLNIPDKIKLKAKRRAKEEEDHLFKTGSGLETGVRIIYVKDQHEEIFVQRDDGILDIKVSRNWIEDNLDFPTLWNNFINIYNFADHTMRLTLDSKKSESGTLEGIIQDKGEHLYDTNYSFGFKEMLSDAEIYSYLDVLNALGVNIETMIEWFFIEYLKEEFQIDDYLAKMPSINASYFEKCRTILPEIDRIFKQFNMLIEEGEIDQELIEISSTSVKNKGIKSFNEKKYVYSSSEWIKMASFLLFSSQSSISYLPNIEEKYENFYELIQLKNLTSNDFEKYQQQELKWLIDNAIIFESEDSYIKCVDEVKVFILKDLYFHEVLNYWRYPQKIRNAIDELFKRGDVVFENTLFSRCEQDYLDYYLNKSKFTNGQDIRNKYMHGTNKNDERQYKIDYYKIIKLIVIIILKINDDLCIKDDCVNSVCR